MREVVAPSRASDVRRLSLTCSVALAAVGFASEIAYRYFGASFEPVVQVFSLSYEHNLPTWFSACILFSCGLALAAIASRQRVGQPHRWHWWGLSAAFFYISFDETAQIHEHLGQWELHGVLYFSWVVPAAAVVALLGALYLPFLRRLSPRRRRQFIVAGVLYVGGALFMELPLGWWYERAGDENLVYAAIDHLEEVLEMIGASLFLSALVEELGEIASPAVEAEAA
jgi:hypothetical protein